MTSAHQPWGHRSPASARSPLTGTAAATATAHRYTAKLTQRRSRLLNDCRYFKSGAVTEEAISGRLCG